MHGFTLRPCRCYAAGEASSDGSGDLPAGYTAATHLPEPGKAPAMRYRLIDGGGGRPRSWAIILLAGDEVMSGLSDWIKAENVRGAHLCAIGAFSSATFGWFDIGRKAYKDVPIDQQVECVSLTGDVGITKRMSPPCTFTARSPSRTGQSREDTCCTPRRFPPWRYSPPNRPSRSGR